MKIKDFNFLSYSNNYDKSHYFNNLIIQEQNIFRLHYFSDMEGFFRINKIKCIISSGSFFITHPGDHFTITVGKTQRTLGYFMISMTLDNDETDFLKTELTDKSYILNSNQRMIIEEVMRKLNSQNTYLNTSARHQLQAFLYDLPDYQKQVQTYNDQHKYIEKAIKYMQEHVFDELKLHDLCDYLCISEPHCIRLFKGRMGTTPMKYFSRIKIEEAVSLLLTTPKPLGIIAEDLKFSSASHFSKTFKQYLSISPTQYRSNYINTLEHRQKMSIKEQENTYGLLQNIIDASPDLIFIKDSHGVFMGGNKAFFKIMGKPRDQIIGKSDYETFPKESADFFQKRDDMIYRNRCAIKNEEVMTYPNGRKRTFEVYKAPFYDDQGNITGLIGISRDITDRINARKTLEASNSRQKQLSDRHAEVLISISNQLIEQFNQQYQPTNETVEILQMQLLTEGLHSFLQYLFKKISPDNHGIDPNFLFSQLNTLLQALSKGSLDHESTSFNLEMIIPKELPEIVFTDDKRLIRALFFLVLTLVNNIQDASLAISFSIRDKQLTVDISMITENIPENKQKKIEKLIQREEGFAFIASLKDPIELCLANMELECLQAKITIKKNTNREIRLDISFPFPHGIEYLNKFYAPKSRY